MRVDQGYSQTRHLQTVTSRRVLTEGDILKAVFWRLGNPGRERARFEIEHVRAFLAERTAETQSIEEDDVAVREVLALLRRTDDRRGVWGLLMALISFLSHKEGDRDLFFRAGMEVVTAYRQANLGASGGRCEDSLTIWIAAFLEDHPEANTAAVIDGLIGSVRHDPMIEEFDSSARILTYQPHQGSERLKDIDLKTLARRVQRVRSSLRFHEVMNLN